MLYAHHSPIRQLPPYKIGHVFLPISLKMGTLSEITSEMLAISDEPGNMGPIGHFSWAILVAEQ